MARETVARCACLICSTEGAEIRRNVKGKLYLHCAHSCGLVQATGQGAQAHLERALAAAVAAAAAEAEKPEPAQDVAADVGDLDGLDNPAGQPTEKPKKRGLFAALSEPII